MSARGGETGRAVHNGSGPRLVPLSVAATQAAEPDYIDEALDGLVTTVDDLVRDLAVNYAESPPVAYPFVTEPDPERLGLLGGPAAPGGAPAPALVHSKAFVAALVLALIAFEFVVLAWLLSNL
jgi:hypothetical protein